MVTEAEWDYLRQDRNSALKNIDKLKSIRAEIKKNKEKRKCI